MIRRGSSEPIHSSTRIGIASRQSVLWLIRVKATQRCNLRRKFLDIKNPIGHSIKTFGLKVGKASRGQFEPRVPPTHRTELNEFTSSREGAGSQDRSPQ
jgi:hypothetical protein